MLPSARYSEIQTGSHVCKTKNNVLVFPLSPRFVPRKKIHPQHFLRLFFVNKNTFAFKKRNVCGMNAGSGINVILRLVVNSLPTHRDLTGFYTFTFRVIFWPLYFENLSCFCIHVNPKSIMILSQ